MDASARGDQALGLTCDLLGVSAMALGLEPRTPELAERFAWWGCIAFEAFALAADG